MLISSTKEEPQVDEFALTPISFQDDWEAIKNQTDFINCILSFEVFDLIFMPDGSFKMRVLLPLFERDLHHVRNVFIESVRSGEWIGK